MESPNSCQRYGGASGAARSAYARSTSDRPATAASRCRWLASGSCRPVSSPSTTLAGCDGSRTRAVQPDRGRFRPAALLGHPDFRERYGGRVLSTTLALVWVAAGRRAAYITDGRFEDNVHFASGIAICRAAGCVVTDLHGEPVDSPGGSGLLVAADGETHQRLLQICASSYEGIGQEQV